MNIVFHSAQNFAFLLIANCACGVITAVLAILMDVLALLLVNPTSKRFLAFGDYISANQNRNKLPFVSDFVLCVIAAAFILFTCFVYNSGNFRIIAIPAFFVGMSIGRTVLNKTITSVLNYILFCLKWLFDIASFPVFKSVSFLARGIRTVFIIICQKRRTKIISKYTTYCFLHLKDEAKYGLIDDFYKELENERTV